MTQNTAAQRPRYLGRDGADFLFEAGPHTDPAAFLAALGISKAESGRIRAQGRIACVPATPASPAAFALTPRRDPAAPAPAAPAPPHATSPALAILHEDDFCLAVHKPAPLLVHGDGTGTPTLSDQVAAYLAQKGDLLAPQALQRLDVDTTGVVLFSKAVEFQGLFDALVADHRLMTKRYLAAVRGAYPVSHDRLAAPIARDRHDARRMRALDPGRALPQGAQQALTLVERLAVAPDASASLLRVTLMTGRRHQIRAHLAHRGFPILGDALYGSARPAEPRLMLHALSEGFLHPVLGVAINVISPFTEDFVRLFPDAFCAKLPE